MFEVRNKNIHFSIGILSSSIWLSLRLQSLSIHSVLGQSCHKGIIVSNTWLWKSCLWCLSVEIWLIDRVPLLLLSCKLLVILIVISSYYLILVHTATLQCWLISWLGIVSWLGLGHRLRSFGFFFLINRSINFN